MTKTLMLTVLKSNDVLGTHIIIIIPYRNNRHMPKTLNRVDDIQKSNTYIRNDTL